MNKIDKRLDIINKFFRKKRDSLLKPLLKILNRLGISANNLSISKIFFTIIYLLFIKSNFSLAMSFLLFGGVFLDFLDGPLARYTNKDSDRGKFIDVLSDQIVYILAIWGLIIINIGNYIILSYNIIIISLFYLLIIINKNENIESDWIIKPVARATYYKLIFEILTILYLLSQIDIIVFNKLIFIINSIITIHFIYHLIKFSNKKYFKNKLNTL